MARATDVERDHFILLLDCMPTIDLVKPFVILDNKAGKSLRELAIKYSITKRQVEHIINCHKLRDTKSKESIKG